MLTCFLFIFVYYIQIKDDDITSPNCIILQGNGTCTPDMIRHDCTTHFWSLRVGLRDDRAIAQIIVSDYVVSVGNYTLDRSDAANIDVLYE